MDRVSFLFFKFSDTDPAFNIPGSTLQQTIRTQCLQDSFTVTCPGARAPTVLCGENAGQHSKTWVKRVDTSAENRAKYFAWRWYKNTLTAAAPSTLESLAGAQIM